MTTELGFSLAIAGLVVLFATSYWLRRQQKRVSGRAAFHAQELTTLLAAGRTGATSVRLWGRTSAPGRHRLELWPDRGESGKVQEYVVEIRPAAGADQTFVVDYPTDVHGAAPLQPTTVYRCRLTAADGDPVGVARFETAPTSFAECPTKFAIAAFSCHLPFDDDGHRDHRASRLLEVMPAAMDAWEVKRVIMMGDQMYSDLPDACSLFERAYFQHVAPRGRKSILDCSRAEVRRLYQRRYRLFWGDELIRRVQSGYSCHLVPDDHEIVDNFGTAPEHARAEYQALAGGALDAFYDYQAARSFGRAEPRPPAFWHEFEYGTFAAFVMDLRSERRYVDEDTIVAYGDGQAAALERFLASHREHHVVAVVLSVPLLHIPDWLAAVGKSLASADGDLADRWSNPCTRASRDRLLALLRDHQRACPHQRLVILGGDIHMGAVIKLDWGNDTRWSAQLISSAVTNAQTALVQQAVRLAPDAEVVIDEDGVAVRAALMSGESVKGQASQNPFGGLNFGIVEIERITPEESTMRLLLVGCADGETAEPRIVFDSGRL